MMSNKLEWITKCQKEFEKLLNDYHIMKEDILKSINKKYEEELQELEGSIRKGKDDEFLNFR